jgi:hypothetical protein
MMSPMVGKQFLVDGRVVTVTGFFTGHGDDDPPGWYYQFEHENIVHFISATAAAVRFQQKEGAP